MVWQKSKENQAEKPILGVCEGRLLRVDSGIGANAAAAEANETHFYPFSKDIIE
jgi:hypothetical protein